MEEASKSQRKQGRDRWNLQQKQLEIMLSKMPGGMIVCSVDSGKPAKWISNSFCEMLGYTDEEEFSRVTNELASHFIYDGDYERVCRSQAEQLAKGDTYYLEYRAYCQDGHLIWIADFGKCDWDDTGEKVLYCFLTDITERKKETERMAAVQQEVKRLHRIEEQVRLVETQALRAAVSTTYLSTMSINLTQDTYNCFIEEQLCYFPQREGVYSILVDKAVPRVEKGFRQLFTQNLSRENLLERFQAGCREVFFEIRYYGLDRKFHWVSLLMIPVIDPVGEDCLAIGLIKIIDEQRQTQARQEQILRTALAAAQSASQAKSEFLSRMSHDIRTPMNAILGMSAIGRLNLDHPDRLRDCFHKIDIASEYLLSILNNILDVSKIEQGKFFLQEGDFSFERLLQEIETIIQPQMQEKKIHFRIVRGKDLAQHYHGDALRLKQICMNLLSNALKFTAAGGQVALWADEQKRKGQQVYLHLGVTDNGTGMSEDFQKRLFQPFEQETTDFARNQTGSGLGLSIVHRCVELMGGTIEVHSKKNQGTHIAVMIPLLLAEGESVPAEAVPSAGMPALNAQGKRILVVEDNELNREIAQTLLTYGGFSVDTVEDGQAAVEAIRQVAAGYYYAILMDIRMPKMDGLTATRAIRELDHPDAGCIPILGMSANAFLEDRSKAYAAGMNDYLVKPIEMAAVMDALEKAGRKG